MNRDIVETERIDREQLKGVTARLEQDSDSWEILPYTGTEAEKIFRYRFDEDLGNGESWYGQLDVEIYEESFQARGDEVLVDDYFAENQIQELDLD